MMCGFGAHCRQKHGLLWAADPSLSFGPSTSSPRGLSRSSKVGSMMAGGVRFTISGCKSVVATADGVVQLASSNLSNSSFQEN